MRHLNPFLFYLCKTLAKVFYLYYHNIEIQGNLPTNTPALLLPKHTQWTDIFVILLSINQPTYFIGKAELFKFPFKNLLLTLGYIPLNRKAPIKTLSYLKHLLSIKNESIIIFPEGTYYQIVGPIHNGLIKLILKHHNFPLVPIGIKYKDRNVRVRIGEACEINEIGAEISRLSNL